MILILGFEKGTIILYKHDNTDFCKILNPSIKEQITCADISKDISWMIAGFSKGTICLFNLDTTKTSKMIENPQKSILFIKFLNFSKEIKEKISFILGCEDKILVIKWKHKKVFNLKRKEIIKTVNLNHYFNFNRIYDAIPFIHPERKKNILAISTLKKILIIDLQQLKEPLFEFEKPDFVPQSFFPSITWIKSDLLSNFFSLNKLKDIKINSQISILCS